MRCFQSPMAVDTYTCNKPLLVQQSLEVDQPISNENVILLRPSIYYITHNYTYQQALVLDGVAVKQSIVSICFSGQPSQVIYKKNNAQTSKGRSLKLALCQPPPCN